jgi:hypothetical protein
MNYAAERAYIFDVLLREFLGLEFVAISEVRDDVSISWQDTATELRVKDVFFQTLAADWLKKQSLPELPLTQWQLPELFIASGNSTWNTLPVLFGKSLTSGSFFVRHDNSIDLGLDIFGSAFFMLTRYEETCSPRLDEFSRFPACASIAVRGGFLERPIVNEYLEIFWSCLQALRPGMVRKTREYRLDLSHDVDRIFDTRGEDWSVVLKNASGDIVKRRDIALAARRIYSKARSGGGDFRHEPCNTFDFIMDCSEQYGIRSAFYFIVHQGAEELDGDYAIDMPWVRSMLRHIHARGHELGLHGSYISYDDPAQIAAEFQRIQTIAEEEGIHQSSWGGRQHYLRWDAGTTWQGWEDAGLAYDSTLAFPEAVGFRSGTCYEYPAFNLLSRCALKLYERPLVIMETSLFSEHYMNLSADDALETIDRLSSLCRRFDGSFTLLWHNDNLVQARQKKLYRNALELAG